MQHRKGRRLLIFWALFGVIFLQSQTLPAQSRIARRHFEKAEKATLIDEKIKLYQQAISADPAFTEAYYKLGLTFEAAGRSEDAMQYLGRALFSRPTDLDAEQRQKIVLEIGRIQFKLGQYPAAKSSLLGALNLAAKKPDRIEILKTLARVLAAAEEHDAAIARFQELIREDPQNQTEYQQSITGTKHIQEIDMVYRDAVQLMNNRRFKGAISGFEKVLELDSDFKDTQTLLTKARKEYELLQKREVEFHAQTIGPATESNSTTVATELNPMESPKTISISLEQSFFEKGKEQLAAKKWDEAVKSFEAALTINPNHSGSREQLQIAQKEFEKSTQERIVKKYFQEGVQGKNRHDWVKAIIAFEKVLNLQSNHIQARENLDSVQQRLENSGTTSAKQHYYDQAILAMTSQEWDLAEALFIKIQNLDQNYQDTAEKLKFVREKLAQQAELLALYQAGEYQINTSNWQAAIDIFQRVKAQNPDFKNVNLQLRFAEAQLNFALQKPGPGTTILSLKQMIWVGAFLILLLPVIGLFLFSPDFRGRFYLLLEQHDKVIRLYNRLLDKGTISDKLCLALVHQYQLENRLDDLAIKTYERALRLHLLQDPEKQEEVSAILTRYYLGNWEKETREIDRKISKFLNSKLEQTEQK